MRINPRPWLIGTTVLLCGIVWLGSHEWPVDAAEVTEDLLKSLAEQDLKNLQTIAQSSVAAGKFADKNIHAIKSNAMMIAHYAQSQITGKDKARDQKMATLRDQALKVAQIMAGDKKNYKTVEAPAKGLKWMPDADASAKVEKVKLEKQADFSVEDLMHQFKKTTAGGLNTEADLEAYAMAKKITDADAKKLALIAARVIYVGELSEVVLPEFNAKKKKTDWDRFNKAMKEGAGELLEATKGGAAGGKKMTDAVGKINAACTGCHNIFK